jgi:hypothetical protein
VGTVRPIENQKVTCIEPHYNIEVRPTCSQPAVPNPTVVIRLLDSDRRVVREQADSMPPFLLWPGSTDCPAQLPNGVYYLESSAGDGIVFTQACPGDVPGGMSKKGLKGCRVRKERA